MARTRALHASPARAAAPIPPARTSSRGAAAPPPAFDGLVRALFARLTGGLADMAASNAGFAVEADADGERWTLRTGAGAAYELRADALARRVVLTAPGTSFSGGGAMRYRWDASHGEWLDDENGHLLFDKLSRDLVAACKGYPTW